MEETIKITMHNSETVLPKGKREVLAYSSPLLVPCTVTERTDDFDIDFDTTDLKSCKETKSMSMQDKYRLLYNCASLLRLTKEFSFSLSPDNVYSDINLMPKVLKRDIGTVDEAMFLSQYRALIGATLAPKHSFEDYYNGGSDLYNKNGRLKKICTKESVEETASELMEQYRSEEKDVRENKTTVGKKRFLAYRIALPVLAVAAAGCVAFACYMSFFKLPFEEQLLRGSNAYLNNDYTSVQNELSGIGTDKLPYESKYILARSYVISEGLNSDQKDNILTMLTMQTDDVYFDYWIDLGRLDFEKAIDDAQRSGDEQLQLLAYMKYKAFLETDTSTLTGDEKAQKIDELKGKIDTLSKELEEARAGAASENQEKEDDKEEADSAIEP